jgi:tripartite-type tricarboxylate transporter receptor subunit TctC
VPYRGGALATAAVVTGEVQLAFSNMSDAMGQLAAGTVRPLAITTARRSPHMPEIPTLMELGLVDYPVESWNALFAPAGTPQPIIARLAEVMAQMAKDPEIQKRMSDFGSIAVANTPAEFTQMLREETDQWAEAAPSASSDERGPQSGSSSPGMRSRAGKSCSLCLARFQGGARTARGKPR